MSQTPSSPVPMMSYQASPSLEALRWHHGIGEEDDTPPSPDFTNMIEDFEEYYRKKYGDVYTPPTSFATTFGTVGEAGHLFDHEGHTAFGTFGNSSSSSPPGPMSGMYNSFVLHELKPSPVYSFEVQDPNGFAYMNFNRGDSRSRRNLAMSQNISGANGVTRTGNLDNSSEGGATETVNGISQENFGVSNATQTADLISSLGGNASGANGPLWAAGLDSFSENNSSSAGGAIGTVNIISQENLSGSDVTQTANLISSLEENSGANRSIQVENLDNSMEDETGSVDEDGSSEDEHFEIEDMSYENLVLLENVKCTASSAILKTLIGHTFMKNIPSSKSLDELCTICQDKFKDGDSLMILHCSHAYHEACGLEWFLNHSKLCPVCKHDVTDGHL